jgi:hypothetical protein
MGRQREGMSEAQAFKSGLTIPEKGEYALGGMPFRVRRFQPQPGQSPQYTGQVEQYEGAQVVKSQDDLREFLPIGGGDEVRMAPEDIDAMDVRSALYDYVDPDLPTGDQNNNPLQRHLAHERSVRYYNANRMPLVFPGGSLNQGASFIGSRRRKLTKAQTRRALQSYRKDSLYRRFGRYLACDPTVGHSDRKLRRAMQTVRQDTRYILGNHGVRDHLTSMAANNTQPRELQAFRDSNERGGILPLQPALDPPITYQHSGLGPQLDIGNMSVRPYSARTLRDPGYNLQYQDMSLREPPY